MAPTVKPKTPAKRGAAATRGPVPKRAAERRRRNKDSKVEPLKIDGLGPVEVPAPDDDWHPIARDWYLSLAQSGQSTFYEPSDWQYARYVAQVMSVNLNSGRKFSAMLFSAVQSGMADLLTTEGDRRRVRMEIERDAGDEKPSAGVTQIADYRKRLGAGGG